MLRLRRPMISCFAVATVAFPAVLSRRRMTTMRAPQRRALIIDTDAGADDLATLAAAAAAEAPLRLVTTSSGLSPPGHGHLLVRRTLDALGLSQVRVVAGAERPPAYLARAKADWEVDYGPRLDGVVTGCGVEPVTAEQAQDTGSAAAAADAIIETATAAGGGATILALGALTNVAAAWERQPEAFARSVERVVFIGDTQDVPSYNVALDPLAMQTVLRSGVELVLVGHSCFPSPAWVEALFADAPAASLDGGSEAPDAPDAGAAVPAEPAEPAAEPTETAAEPAAANVARSLRSRCRASRGCSRAPVLRRRNRRHSDNCTCWSMRHGHHRGGSRAAGAALAESWEGELSLLRLLDGRRAVSTSLHVHEPGAHACLAVFGQLDELSRRRR